MGLKWIGLGVRGRTGLNWESAVRVDTDDGDAAASSNGSIYESSTRTRRALGVFCERQGEFIKGFGGWVVQGLVVVEGDEYGFD